MTPALLLAALLAAPAEAAVPTLSLDLAAVEKAAKAHSLAARAAAEEAAAAGDRADAQFAALLPRVTLEGSYRYQTEVPALPAAPGQPARPFGDHRATSLGPALSWTLWDQGALERTWRAQRARADSAAALARLSESQAVLGARLAYARAQLAREQSLQLADATALADAQARDIDSRFRAGRASRIDTLSSHQDSLQRRRQFLQAQTELGAALRELFQLTGLGSGLDLARPLDARASSATAAGLPAPTVLVALDDLKDVPPALAAAGDAPLSAAYPGVAAFAAQAEAARLSASAAAAGRGPTVRLQGAVALQYPNGPVLDDVTQKTVGLTASLPLFQGGQPSKDASAQRHLAAAAERRRELAAEELSREHDKARAALASLKSQQELDDQAASDAAELSDLVYLSYKSGRANYLEVQSANLRALEAKVQAARTRAQTLIQLATLAQLAAGG